jgi:hypothetical protein
MSLPLPAPASDNRFGFVTPDDNSAPLIIVAIITLTFSILIFALRILVVKLKGYGIDDLILGCGHVVGVGQWIAILLAIKGGLGKSFDILEARELPRLSKVQIRSTFELKHESLLTHYLCRLSSLAGYSS